MRLMIVDDHPPAREMIRQFLELPGVTICECGSGEEALQQVREFKPNWITVDVSMPGLNGFQTAQALRAEHPPARIVIITSYNETHYQERSREAGAIALVSKENLASVRLLLEREIGKHLRPPPDEAKAAN